MLATNNLFEQRYNLQPAHASFYTSIMNLPWAPKLIYGILVDSFPIFGSTKRAYVVLMGIIQIIFLLLVAFNLPQNPNPGTEDTTGAKYVMWMTTIYSTGGAFMEVVCQGMMVVECRKDPKRGSEDLQSYAWMAYGVGGTIACLFGGWWLTIWIDGFGAQLCYGFTAIFVAVLMVSGPFLNP